MSCRVIRLDEIAVDHQPLPEEQLPSPGGHPAGVTPSTGHTPLETLAALSVGVWEHSVGVSADVEADEVFVVLAGRATIEVEGGPTLELRAGDLGVLTAGAVTRWTVHEALRKVYISPVEVVPPGTAQLGDQRETSQPC